MTVFVPDHIKGVQRSLKSSFFWRSGYVYIPFSLSKQKSLECPFTPLEATGCLITLLLLFMS